MAALEGLKGTVQFDILNLPQVKHAIEVMQEIVNDDRIPVDIRAEYQERFDAIPWQLPTQDDFEREFKDTAERMWESRKRMLNRTWRLINPDGNGNA